MSSMEPALNSSILVMLWIISAVDIFPQDRETVSIIDEVFRRFNFFNQSGLLQFWACSSLPPDSEDPGFTLTLTNQPFLSTRDHIALEDYRRRCLVNNNRLVGLEQRVENWFAGRAAQTRIADHRTRDFVLGQDPHDAEAAGKGQLVLPVFHGQGDGERLVGIIELVTIEPKESYSEDFQQLCQLLQDGGLQSKYMGQMIKVEYNKDTIKFPLSYSARLTDLHREVIERFPELRKDTFCIVSADMTNCVISSDELLHHQMNQSNLRGETLIKMHVLQNLSTPPTCSTKTNVKINKEEDERK